MIDNIPVDTLDGVGPKKKALYQKLGINSLVELLNFFPAGYRDYRKTVNVKDLEIGQVALIQCRVNYIVSNTKYQKKSSIVRMVVEDDSGKLDVVFFNGGYLKHVFKKGDVYYFYGKPTKYKGKVSMANPEYMKASQLERGISPLYHTVKGLSQREIGKNIGHILANEEGKYDQFFQEILPKSIVEKRKLCPIKYLYDNIHNPDGRQSFATAKYRQIYQDFFLFEMGVRFIDKPEKNGIVMEKSGEKYLRMLGFDLTEDQAKAVGDIEKDMASGKKMNRLVQGDVGSGKTAVAEIAMYKAVVNGYQAAFMAPTELLARQHHEKIKDKFEKLGYKAVLLTGGLKQSEKNRVNKEIQNGESHVIIGTHALISENVSFRNLGLVITDEQHRFGVNQRKTFGSKGSNPHMLVMSATPIPRTLAVLFYRNLDVSIIKTMPMGRKKIITERVLEKNRDLLYENIKEEVANKRQVYVVAPLISESEFFENVRSAEDVYQELLERYSKDNISVGLLHGHMKQVEKDQLMLDFKDGKIDVLVATVVIEVGIDVPNATIMIIENAERFGLAQLHQLRGRVGRGSIQSRCFLVSDAKGDVARKRLDTLCCTVDGFEIAEADLKLRGPGEVFGVRQHGVPDEFIVNILEHQPIYEKVCEDIEGLDGYDFSENSALIDRVKKIYNASDDLAL